MLTAKTSGIKGITGFTTYESGELKECKLEEYDLISTNTATLFRSMEIPGSEKSS